MRKLVVHLGPHKSGTTSFQSDLVALRPALSAMGVCVPLVGGDANAWAVSRELVGKPVRSKAQVGALARFKNEAASSDAETILTSSEHFELSLRNGRALDRLVQFGTKIGAEIVVVAVVRDNASYINGWYQQCVRTLQERQLFAPWLESAVAFPRFDYNASFRQVLNHPKVDFRAVPFSRAAEQGITSAIMAELEIDVPVGWQESTWLNPSIGPRSVALCRAVAAPMMLAQARGLEAANTRRSVSWQLMKATTARGWNRAPFWGFDNGLLDQTTSFFATSNENFAQRVWGHSWTESPPAHRVHNERASVWRQG